MLTVLYGRPGERAGRVEKEADIARHLQEGKGVLWADLEKPTESEVRVLSTIFRFHQLAIGDCLAETSHPKVDDYGDYLYLVMHGAVAGVGHGAFRTQELDLFCGKNFLVTHRSVQIQAVDDLRKRCLEVEGHIGRGGDFLLHDILDDLADSFTKVIESLDVEVDQVESKLFRKPSTRVLGDIFAIKKDILRIKRVVLPQREVLNRLARGEFKVISKEAQPYFRGVFDHVYRVAELTESFRDVVTSALETYLTVVSNRTNEVVRVLTVFSIVLMSLALIAGIYGMNVPLPLAQSRAALWIVLGFMTALAGGLLLFFKSRRWI